MPTRFASPHKTTDGVLLIVRSVFFYADYCCLDLSIFTFLFFAQEILCMVNIGIRSYIFNSFFCARRNHKWKSL